MDAAAGAVACSLNPRASSGPVSIEPGGPGAFIVAGPVVTCAFAGAMNDTASAASPGVPFRYFPPTSRNAVSDWRCHSAVRGVVNVTSSMIVNARAPSHVNVRVNDVNPTDGGYAAARSATTRSRPPVRCRLTNADVVERGVIHLPPHVVLRFVTLADTAESHRVVITRGRHPGIAGVTRQILTVRPDDEAAGVGMRVPAVEPPLGEL